MSKFLYNLLFPVIFVLLLPGYLRRMVRRGNYRQNFWQRLGRYAPDLEIRLANQTGNVWVQAVSVGEMLVALKLLAALRGQAPELPIVISTTTTTGFALAQERVPNDVIVLYTPVDLAGAVRRAFDAIQPAQLIVVDGGLWPNQLWEAKQRKTPTALVNARLSPRSEQRFRRFPHVAKMLYGVLDLVCVTEFSDLQRWQHLSIERSKLHHTGSIKFDDASPQTSSGGTSARDDESKTTRGQLAALGVTATTPILLAGSTHPHEEIAVTKAFLKLRRHFPDLLLIVAPRHVERTAEMQAELNSLGLRTVLRTAIPADLPKPDAPIVLIINTTGELRDWYSAATLVFIGKSLHAVGGQNPAEAIAAGVPVIVGPHMENFQELTTRLLAADAIVQISSKESLASECLRLLSDPAERQRLAEAARAQLTLHRGAASRTATILLAQLRKTTCQKG